MLRKLSLTVCACLLALAGCNNTSGTGDAGAPSSNQTESGTTTVDASQAYVRSLHVVPGVGALDVRARERDSDRDVATLSGTTFGNASAFVALAPNRYRIYAYGTDGKSKAGPMPVTLEEGEDMTVVVNGVSGDVAMLPFKHKNGGPQAGQAKVAFMHAAKSLPAVDVIIDSNRYRGGVKYGVATDYRVLDPGRHTMQVKYRKTLPPLVYRDINAVPPDIRAKLTLPTPTPEPTPTPVPTPADAGALNAASPPVTTETEVVETRTKTVEIKVPQYEDVTLTQQLDLAAGQVYSVIVFQDEAKLPKLRLLEDKFAAELKTRRAVTAMVQAIPRVADGTALQSAP
jgi:hypothetical protein